jgi:AcrR family transcriptional regulator
MSAPRTARALAREELTRSIKEVARRHLREAGATGLSLRAVARELEMASSAIYRYVASRDDLLTALIVDAYDGLGAAVERAEADIDREDHADRWLTACRAVRTWALAHPHEYALVYGSPVPGYRAPEDTIAPAARTAVVALDVVRDALAAAALAPPPAPEPPAEVAEDLARFHDGLLAGLSADVATRAIVAWTSVFGLVSFELFGQYQNVIDHREAFFDHAAAGLGRSVGLAIAET